MSRSDRVVDTNDATIEELLDIEEDVASVNDSRADRARFMIDSYVMAPARIAANDWRALLGASILTIFALTAVVLEPTFETVYRYQNPVWVRPFNSNYTHHVFNLPQFTVFGWTYTGIWQYPLGTDKWGQPIFQRMVNAAPGMWKLIIAGGIVSIAFAVIIGITAGYKGGLVDDILMGFTDIVLTIPGLPFIILLTAIFYPTDPYVLGALLAIDNWPGLARSLRSQVLTIRNESYVEADRSMGVGSGGILTKDVLPQLLPFVMINVASASKKVITEAVGLYFLGILPLTAANWGVMMDQAYQSGALGELSTLYWIFWPMLVLALLSFALVMLAQGLDQVFNPRLRARHAKHAGGEEESLD